MATTFHDIATTATTAADSGADGTGLGTVTATINLPACSAGDLLFIVAGYYRGGNATDMLPQAGSSFYTGGLSGGSYRICDGTEPATLTMEADYGTTPFGGPFANGNAVAAVAVSYSNPATTASDWPTSLPEDGGGASTVGFIDTPHVTSVFTVKWDEGLFDAFDPFTGLPEEPYYLSGQVSYFIYRMIAFTSGATYAGTSNMTSRGSASKTVSFPAAQENGQILVAWGDVLNVDESAPSGFQPSPSPTMTITVTGSPVSIGGFHSSVINFDQNFDDVSCDLGASPNPADVSDNIVFTATVTNDTGSITPFGPVDFYYGATHLGSGTLFETTPGTAAASYTLFGPYFSAGAYTIQAQYAGNDWFNSTSCSVDVTVTGGGGGGCTDGFCTDDAANDDFADRVVITGESGTSDTICITNATTQGSEPIGSNVSTLNQTIWFEWTAPGTGSVIFDTHGSLAGDSDSGDGGTPCRLDTTLAVWSGTNFGDFVEVTSNDDDEISVGDFGLSSAVQFDVNDGEVFYIQIGTYDTPYNGQVILAWESDTGGCDDGFCTDDAANDDFSNRITLTGLNGNSDTICITNATTEASEPVGSNIGNGIHQTIWFDWTSPGTGSVIFDTHDSLAGDSGSGDGGSPCRLDTTLATWSGTNFGDFVELASNNDDGFVAHTSSVFGAHRRHASGTPPLGDGADAHLAAEADAGRLLGFRCYAEMNHTASGVKGTNRLTTLLEDPDRPLYFSLHSFSPTVTWANVAAGMADSYLTFWRDYLSTYLGTTRPTVFTWHHEPDNDISQLGQPEDWVDALNYVVEFLNLADYPNVSVCGAALTNSGWNGPSPNRPDPQRWYTGTAGVIDFVGGDHYNRYPDSGQDQTLEDLMSPGMAVANAMGLPYFVGEMGRSVSSTKAAWITDAFDYLSSVNSSGMYSDVDATSPVTGNPLNYRVDSSSFVHTAWLEAVADTSGGGGFSVSSVVQFDAVEGETYYIQVGTYDEPYNGQVVLAWTSDIATGGGPDPTPYAARSTTLITRWERQNWW